MKVRLIMPGPGHTGNILWHGKFPMRGGRFPSDHPCSSKDGGADKAVQFGTSPSLDKFRNRGYWASCFPEGDGITFTTLKQQSYDTCKRDVINCFGWEIGVAKETTG